MNKEQIENLMNLKAEPTESDITELLEIKDINKALLLAYKLGAFRVESDIEGDLVSCKLAIDKGRTAISMLLDEYEWDYEPNPYEALAYSRSTSKDKAENRIGKLTYDYICGYKQIMFFSNVANDYMYEVETLLKKLTDFE